MIHNKLNSYGHMAPRYPYSKDDMPQYTPNSYNVNVNLNPSQPLNSQGTTNSHFHPGTNYGSMTPHHESQKYVKSYEKDLSPSHVDYTHTAWPNGNRSDVPSDYYSQNLPSGSTHSYKSDGKQDSFPHHNFNPDHGSHLNQNNWDNPLVNQYSNVRLAIFVENCNCFYELVESDLRELFSYYSGVRCLSISPDYPAAELIVTDPSASNVAASELNGIVLHGIGTLRCVVMRQGQTLESVLSSANIYQNFNKAPSAGTASTAVESSNSRYAYPQNDQTGPKSNSNLLLARKSQSPSGTPKAYSRPLNVNNVEHVSGMTNKPNTKRQARFELIELFSYEPDFDVTSSILGPNNANIEYIMKNANNKVDISIKGKPLNSAPVADRLHLSITSNDFYPYNKAIFMVEDLLSSVCEKFVEYVKGRGKVVSNLVGFRRHEYEEDSGGVLDYKGYLDKPKTWLDGNTRRYSQYKPRTNYSKKVNDRSRPISNTRPQNTRLTNTSKSRNLRK